jgi:hypothetical protein
VKLGKAATSGLCSQVLYGILIEVKRTMEKAVGRRRDVDMEPKELKRMDPDSEAAWKRRQADKLVDALANVRIQWLGDPEFWELVCMGFERRYGRKLGPLPGLGGFSHEKGAALFRGITDDDHE